MTLTRERIKVRSVRSRIEGEDIAYIRITTFNEQTTEGLKRDIAKLQAFADLLKQKLTVTGNLAKTEMEHEHQSEQAQMQQDFQTQQQFDQLAAEMGKAEHQHELGMEQDDAAR